MITVIKKDGSKTVWDDQKIRDAVNKSSDRLENTSKQITNREMNLVIKGVQNRLRDRESISTRELHELVMDSLYEYNQDVCVEYKAYRNYKIRFGESFQNVAEHSHKIVYSGDKENANKDSALNSTKQALISESVMRELLREFEMDQEWLKAHDEGWIHIHDLGSRYLNQINCCLFDMGNLLDGGFQMNGSEYLEPKTIQTAWAVVGDVTLTASSQQYGGYTISEIDTVLKKYAKLSYDRHLDYLHSKGIKKKVAEEMAEEMTIREIEQGYQGFETKLNTVSNSLG